MTKIVYDVRARYGGGRTWVRRCDGLWGLLWFLWFELRDRVAKHPDWTDEPLRWEIVRQPETHTQGWDPLRLSQQLHAAAGDAPQLMINSERLERIETALKADDDIGPWLLDATPDTPADTRPIAVAGNVVVTRDGLHF